MKKVASINEVRRMALATGAKAEIGGEVFNAGQLRVAARPPAAPVVVAKPPEPVATVAPSVPASAPTVTRDELERLIAERDAFWMAEVRKLNDSIAATITRVLTPHPAKPTEWKFTPVYDRSNVLKSITATPS